MKKTLIVTLAALSLAGCLETTSTGQRGFLPSAVWLTPDEQVIWAGLTDEEKLHAIPYLQNGGTLVSSLGAQ